MINLHRLVRTAGGSGGEHRRVVDGRSDNAGTNPPPAQSQTCDGSLICVYAGRCEKHFIRSRSYGAGDHLSRPVNGLRG
jgi:hypothetical protein